MFLYVADQGKENTLSIQHMITADELNSLNAAFAFTSVFHAITQIKNIVIENGIYFQNWMKPSNLETNRVNGLDADKLIMRSNKHALNYASSVKTFIDMESTILAQRKPDAVSVFHELTHQFYDSHMEYRFWANFRNYIVHCSFPYSEFTASIGRACEVKCTKQHLLSFDNWKHAKADIEKMPEVIDLPSLINPMSGLIMALYINFFTYFGSDISNCIEVYGEFCRSHNVLRPVIVHCEKENDFGNGHIQPLPIGELKKMFDLLKDNPNVNISIK